MTRLLRAEVRRCLSTPTVWWLLLGTAGIGIVGTIAPLVAADATPAELLTDHQLQQALHGAAAGAILVVVAGVIAMAGEWRYGQGTQTFLTTPQRWRVVMAKSVVTGGVGIAYGIVAGAASVATAWAWYRAEGVALPFERSAVWLTLLGCIAVSALFGVIGVALGAVVRNQVAAIVLAVAWQALLEPALFAASPSVFRWLPGVASFALRRQPTEGLLGAGEASFVLVVFVVVLLAVGTWLVERDDVTA